MRKLGELEYQEFIFWDKRNFLIID